jgi:hypothetical protein
MPGAFLDRQIFIAVDRLGRAAKLALKLACAAVVMASSHVSPAVTFHENEALQERGVKTQT